MQKIKAGKDGILKLSFALESMSNWLQARVTSHSEIKMDDVADKYAIEADNFPNSQIPRTDMVIW